MSSGIGLKSDAAINIDNKAVGYIKKDARLVAEAIHRLLNTSPYERPREAFGCNIRNLLFEPNDFISTTIGGFYINQALSKFETRATVESIIFVTDNTKPNKLQYRIIFRLAQEPEQLFSTTVSVGI